MIVSRMEKWCDDGHQFLTCLSYLRQTCKYGDVIANFINDELF